MFQVVVVQMVYGQIDDFDVVVFYQLGFYVVFGVQLQYLVVGVLQLLGYCQGGEYVVVGIVGYDQDCGVYCLFFLCVCSCDCLVLVCSISVIIIEQISSEELL